MSVRLFLAFLAFRLACSDSALTGRIFMAFDIWVVFKNLSRKNFHYQIQIASSQSESVAASAILTEYIYSYSQRQRSISLNSPNIF